MANFCVNTEAQSNGDAMRCMTSTRTTGVCQRCLTDVTLGGTPRAEAVREAKHLYSQSNGCAWCATACHRS